MSTPAEPRRPWRVVRGLLPPVALIGSLLGVLLYGLQQLADDSAYEQAVLHEWVQETRVGRQTLPEMVRDLYALPEGNDRREKAEAIQAHLAVMGDLTRAYPGQLPLFPVIYRLELSCPTVLSEPILWESGLPQGPGGGWEPLSIHIYDRDGSQAVLHIVYQLHAYSRWQEASSARRIWLSVLAVVVAGIAALWLFFFLRHEQERSLQRLKAETAERRLLEQELATQEAERAALEAKTQMYAHIGIMAGSYAHNIKNLMVRPTDLLRRCQEASGLPAETGQWLLEMEHSLHEVMERTQQILRMVRADPTRAERSRCNLTQLLRDVTHTWQEMAQDKWKLQLHLQVPAEPVLVEADTSQLTQTLENLVFNARDATFEMRGALREEARQGADSATRKEALLQAAAWRGEVWLRLRDEEQQAVLEVQDNGIGMTTEVLARCTEPHFSTKRDSALHEGYATGMGLGLSFVRAVVEHHQGQMQISSVPRQGATFTLRFPVVHENPT